MTIDGLISSFKRAVKAGYKGYLWGEGDEGPVVGILKEQGIWDESTREDLRVTVASGGRPSVMIGSLLEIDPDAAWIIYMLWSRERKVEDVITALKALARGERPRPPRYD